MKYHRCKFYNGGYCSLANNSFGISETCCERDDCPQLKEKSMEIFIKEGWILNPNPKVVESIKRGVERCDGECPCRNKYAGTKDALCPCKAYREEDHCCCGLYIKEK